jgi:arabinogalactan endo-1,4-beta-galactosidase
MKALTQTVVSAGGSGVVYWEPAWISSGCATRWAKGSSWENSALFDYEPGNAHSGFDFLSADYERPVELELVFTQNRNSNRETVYLWASFFESNSFVVPLVMANGTATFRTELPAGKSFRYQVFADSTLKQGLVEPGDRGADGMIAATMGSGHTRVKATLISSEERASR